MAANHTIDPPMRNERAVETVQSEEQTSTVDEQNATPSKLRAEKRMANTSTTDGTFVLPVFLCFVPFAN